MTQLLARRTRFAVVDRVKTEAVLSNDDDLFYTPESAEYLFRVHTTTDTHHARTPARTHC
jgi:hypothetical protein